MATVVSYETGTHEEYASTPVMYRVIKVDGVEVSRDLATTEEIASNPELQTEYLSTLSGYLVEKASSVIDPASVSNVDYYDLIDLHNCVLYMLHKLSKKPDPTVETE